MPGSTHTSGTSTPTRSCLKHSQHHQHTLDAACCSTRKRPGVKPQLVPKTVSFDGHEPQHVYLADYDYDRQSVPVASKLSYEDLLELKKLKIHLMCPRNHQNCNIIPVGILPLLPPSNPPSSTYPASSIPPHIDSSTPRSHDGVSTNHHSHPTPPPSSSDDDHSDSPPPLAFRSSLDKTDPADPASPLTPTRRSFSPLKTRKMAQHTSPSQPLARDVPLPSERLAALCAPTVTGSPILPTLPTFQIGSSTHRSAPGTESDSDSDHCHHRHHHQYSPSKRKALKRHEPSSDEDEAVVVAPPFAPPPCPYIQPSATLLSQPVAGFSLAQPTQPPLALPKMPLFPFMPLLPTPPQSSRTTPAQSNSSSPRSQSPTGTPSLIPMQVTLPPLELVGVPSPGLTPPSPFSLYPAEVTNPRPNRPSSGTNSLIGLTEKARLAAAEGKGAPWGMESPSIG